MFKQEIGGFLYLDYNTLVYLESLNLSYKEMIPYFAIKVSELELCKAFKKHCVKHKKYTDKLFEIIKNSNLSISQLCKKYDVSKSTVCRIKKKIRQLQGQNIDKFYFDEFIKEKV